MCSNTCSAPVSWSQAHTKNMNMDCSLLSSHCTLCCSVMTNSTNLPRSIKVYIQSKSHNRYTHGIIYILYFTVSHSRIVCLWVCTLRACVGYFTYSLWYFLHTVLHGVTQQNRVSVGVHSSCMCRLFHLQFMVFSTYCTSRCHTAELCVCGCALFVHV